MDQKEQEELDQQQQTALDKEQEMDDDGAATVHTYKKSQYWTKEVEEKLGLGGADPYGLLELEERRWRASADEIRKAYRKLVLTKHPDKKAAMDAATTASAACAPAIRSCASRPTRWPEPIRAWPTASSPAPAPSRPH
jgi:hypothetical protein